MIVKTNRIDLAAFIYMEGNIEPSVSGKKFVFQSVMPLAEWENRYYNSESFKHNKALLEIKALKRSISGPRLK
jgi:hypothetical protein